MMNKAVFLAVAALTMTGCSHNINVRGFGFATPYGAFGYGTFSCVKDNVRIESTESTTPEGVVSSNILTIGEQTTGYDVELVAAEKEATK